jgi:hypothetical protein
MDNENRASQLSSGRLDGKNGVRDYMEELLAISL